MTNEGRFYEHDFPDIDEVVVCQVKRIVDMGAYVSLLEYNGREGMMLLSELSKRRIRSVSKILKVGRIEYVMVLRADHDKGYIDLSKRRVDAEDAGIKEKQFADAKAVHGVMRHVAHLNDIDVDELCNKVSWPLFKNKTFVDAHDAFKKHINEEVNVWDHVDWTQPGEDLSEKAEKLKEDIETMMKRRLILQELRMRARVDVSCNEFEGIDAIKEALMEGMKASSEECEIKCQLLAHPTFMFTCNCRDKVLGLSTLEKACELTQKAIVAKGGEFSLRTKPEIQGQEEKEEKEGEGSGSESGSGSSDSENEGDQDETMGNLDEKALKELEALKVDDD